MARILVIGDVHEPVAHPGYLPFCQHLRDKWKCDRVIFIGDVTDWHAVSFHAHHPDCPGPSDEYALAKECIARWVKAFPEALVCVGNHDERLIRLAESVQIPSKFLRSYTDIWETPGWTWDYEHILDDVYFFHGVSMGGIHPAYNAAKKMLMSVVMGHCHTAAGLKWLVNPVRRIFAMDTGCGIDVHAYQFAYGHHARQKPVISAGVVIDGTPYHEICPIGPGERFSRAKVTKKRRR